MNMRNPQLSILVSCGYYKNDHKLGSFKQQKFSHSSEGKHNISFPWLKSKCQQGCVPSSISRGESNHCLFQPLVLLVFFCCGHITPISASIFFFPSFWLHLWHMEFPGPGVQSELHHSHCNAVSKSYLQSTSQLVAMMDP